MDSEGGPGGCRRFELLGSTERMDDLWSLLVNLMYAFTVDPSINTTLHFSIQPLLWPGMGSQQTSGALCEPGQTMGQILLGWQESPRPSNHRTWTGGD